MSSEERYARLERKLEETNRIIDEKYWCVAEEMEEKHQSKINFYDNYYNGIAVMNDKLTHAMLESNVKERKTYERNLTRTFERDLVGSFEKLDSFNKVSCQEVVKTLEDVNLKIGTKIKSENDKIISDFNHVMM